MIEYDSKKEREIAMLYDCSDDRNEDDFKTLVEGAVRGVGTVNQVHPFSLIRLHSRGMNLACVAGSTELSHA
jgi:hypothetical protein